MGQQQILLIILGVIIVGVAIAVGIGLFGAQNTQSNKDAMINDLTNISAHAFEYKSRMATMGGGGGSYTNYSLPAKMATNENGSYAATPSGASVTFVATSTQNATNSITVVIDSDGRMGSWTYSGDFQ